MTKNNHTILHIEDNFENRVLVRRLLQFAGFDIHEAENAYDALEQLESVTPDIILMDINMPDIDGYSLTRQLKSNIKFRNVPIIAITANVMKGDREKSFLAGCDGYIDKPINVDSFIDQIEGFLSRFNPRKQVNNNKRKL
ncbi:MAG: response regulator [Anaerolineaceae bacterium]|nr:response regulator [Anaerolineaceae bacterium]